MSLKFIIPISLFFQIYFTALVFKNFTALFVLYLLFDPSDLFIFVNFITVSTLCEYYSFIIYAGCIILTSIITHNAQEADVWKATVASESALVEVWTSGYGLLPLTAAGPK